METFYAILSHVIALVLTSVVVDLYVVLRTKLKLQTTTQDKQNMDAEIYASIGAGISKVVEDAPHIIRDGIRNKAEWDGVLDGATQYLKTHFPDRVTQLLGATRVTMDNPDLDNAAVQQTIASRLTNVIPSMPSVPGPGGVASGATVTVATTLPAVALEAALPPITGSAIGRSSPDRPTILGGTMP